jgi:hypothetical protein
MNDPKEHPLAPARLDPDERPLGRLQAESLGPAYVPLKSLEEAKAAPDGVAILQGDDGGQIYLVCPAAYLQ